MKAPLFKGDRVAEAVHYTPTLTKLNEGIVQHANERGARVKFSHRSEVVWLKRNMLILLDRPDEIEDEPKPMKLTEKTDEMTKPPTPPRASLPPAQPKEPMPEPPRPKESAFLADLRAKNIDPWLFLDALSESLKSEGDKEIEDAKVALKEAEDNAAHAETLVIEYRKKVVDAKDNLKRVETRVASLAKRVV